MKTILVLLMLLLIGCAEKDRGLSPLDALPSAPAQPEVSVQASSSQLQSVTGAFRTGTGYSRIEILEVGADHQLNVYALDKLVARLSATNGAGDFILSDISGWTEARMNGDNISVGFKNGERVGLYAGPIRTGLQVNGVRVIGPRLAAIDNATSPEDMVVKFNLLLEALRTHGLIERGTALAGR